MKIAFERKLLFQLYVYFAMQLLTFNFQEYLISMQNSIVNKKLFLSFFRPTLSFRDNRDFLKKVRNFAL